MVGSSKRAILWKVYSRLPEAEKRQARDALDRAFRKGLRRMDAAIAGGTRLETAMRAMIDGMDRFRYRSAATMARYRGRIAHQITDEVADHLVRTHRREPQPMLVWPDHYLTDWVPHPGETGTNAH